MGKDKEDKRSVGTIIFEDIVFGKVKLFRSEDDEPYAILPIGESRQVWHLYSSKVRAWLTKEFWRQENRTASAAGLIDCLRTMEGHANDSVRQKLWTRTASDKNDLYLDLGDDLWRAARIHAGGWQIVSKYPVFFRRSPGGLALPDPLPQGDFNIMRRYVNVGDDANWKLFRTWCLGALRPFGPYPILLLSGIQGSAKTTTAHFARQLIDPNHASIRQEPKSKHDLIVAADNSWIMAFDNLSFLTQEMSDALCCLATGSGFTARKLFTDRDEAVFSFCRPIITTAIEDVATRGDLLDRSLLIHCPVIEPGQRRSYHALKKSFEDDLPLILGGALDIVAAAQQRFRHVKEHGLPRMADWARFGIAVEQALGEEEGSFLRAYESNISVGQHTALENSPVLAALLEAIKPGCSFDGKASDLLELLAPAALVNKDVRRFPKIPSQLSNQLRRLAPVLPAIGLSVRFYTTQGNKYIDIKRVEQGIDTIDTQKNKQKGLDIPEDW